MFRTLVCATTLSVAAAPMAIAWDHTFERGLDLYTSPDTDVVLSLVCDPNTVYGSSESAVLVQTGNDPYASNDISFRFADGISIQARLERGRIAKTDTDDVSWQALLTGFRQFSSVVIQEAEETKTVDLGEAVLFSCT